MQLAGYDLFTSSKIFHVNNDNFGKEIEVRQQKLDQVKLYICYNILIDLKYIFKEKIRA